MVSEFVCGRGEFIPIGSNVCLLMHVQLYLFRALPQLRPSFSGSNQQASFYRTADEAVSAILTFQLQIWGWGFSVACPMVPFSWFCLLNWSLVMWAAVFCTSCQLSAYRKDSTLPWSTSNKSPWISLDLHLKGRQRKVATFSDAPLLPRTIPGFEYEWVGETGPISN